MKKDKVLFVAILMAVLGSIGVLSYVIATPEKVSERFTEFYILGPEGNATDYVTELEIGDEGKVIIGIVNREHERVSYRVEIAISGTRQKGIGPIVLENGEKWEGEVSFKPSKMGDNQKVEFLLYHGSSLPKEQLYLWVNVMEHTKGIGY